MTSAIIQLYGTSIGAVSWDPDRELGIFEYDSGFLGSGIGGCADHHAARAGPIFFPQFIAGHVQGPAGTAGRFAAG